MMKRFMLILARVSTKSNVLIRRILEMLNCFS